MTNEALKSGINCGRWLEAEERLLEHQCILSLGCSVIEHKET
jgi:hypothetical protein